MQERRVTPRAAATLVGRIMWEQHISLRPLLLIDHIIEITRRCAASAAADGWDAPTPSLSDDMRVLCAQAQVVVLTYKDWRSAPVQNQTTRVFAASDSSSIYGGYIIWKEDRTVECCISIPWKIREQKMHIFLKELLTATILTERLCETYTGSVLCLGQDNTAALWCLRRLFSSTHHGQEMIMRVYCALTESNNRIEMLQLSSADNPADVPTRPGKRNGGSLEERTEKFWKIVEGQEGPSQGRRCAATSSIRHDEHDLDDGFEGDDEANAEDPDGEFWEIAIPEDRDGSSDLVQ